MHIQFQSVPKPLRQLDEKHPQSVADGLLKNVGKHGDASAFVEFCSAVASLSPYLKDCILKEEVFLLRLLENGFDVTNENLIKQTASLGISLNDEAGFMTSIRQAKRQAALMCALADLGGWWNGETVTQKLSDFANTALSACMDFVLLENHHAGKLVLEDPGKPQEGCGFVILGMGKLGAGELNYSSDIDLIFIHDASASMKLNTDDTIGFLSRVARKLIKLMQERTSDGYVFRMDIRLRPDPSSTPLVIPLEAALTYYEGQGQNWERAAMIKARPVAGDIASGHRFLKELEPFIWRKYLDFAAINDVQSIKRQIHAHKGHGEIAVRGHNIKLGRGGIREIEFFAQTQQLIAGGRNVELRTNRTIAALAALNEQGWIEEDALRELTEAYWFLRNLEHRLQMVDDHQTHTLPSQDDELMRLALMCGEDDLDSFFHCVRGALETVERHYSELFEQAEELGSGEGNLVFTGDDEDPETIKTLEAMGFERPREIIRIIKSWHVARLPALRATQARELLTELVPAILKAFSATNRPDEVMITFDRFLSGLPAGIQLFSILKNNPSLFDLLIKILGAAPRLADQIARKPHVFDAMIDPQFGEGSIEKDLLSGILKASLERTRNYEMALDEARRFFAQTQFMIGCQFFAGTLNAHSTAMAFTALAEVMIEAMLDLVMKEFAITHGDVKGARVCILGMGRLGSRELTATSDLDLIFLYDFDESSEESSGPKPLPNSLYFIRLMQRFISAMSSPTAEGRLFELDFRLRPSGNSGPLATHFDSFLKYQKNEAWVWEAQSLTRARPVAGDKTLCNEVLIEIPEILKLHNEKSPVRKEILDMRKRIEREKGSNNPWDVKQVSGGVLDIEFIAQWLAIKNGSQAMTLTRDILSDTRHKELSEDHRDKLIKAFDLYNSVLQLQRICLGNNEDMESASTGFVEMLTTILDVPDMKTARAFLKSTQKEISEIFKTLLTEKNPRPA